MTKGWGSRVKAAVYSCFFPVCEVENGITAINYDPGERGRRIPISQWLSMMGKPKHLLKPEYDKTLRAPKEEVERR